MKTPVFQHITLLVISTFLLLSCGSKKTEPKEDLKQERSVQTSLNLFLLSKGLTTDTLKAAFLTFLEKKPESQSVAVVVNATSSDKKKHRKTKKVQKEFHALGFDTTKIHLFDLMKTAPSELSKYDIIYILGGNPFLLLDEVNKSDAGPVLKQLANRGKTLMGYSAGALLYGPDLTLMDHADDLLGFNEDSLTELSCLGLYDFHIFPHYKDFTGQVPELIKRIDEFESKSDLPVYRINDNQGIIYQSGKTRIIGE